MKKRVWGGFCFSLFLSGCASVAPPLPTQSYPAPVAFHVKGRVSVQTEAGGHYGHFEWKHRPEGSEIGLFTPLGQQLFILSQTPHGAELSDGQKVIRRAASLEVLLSQLGLPLPVAGLPHWLFCAPLPTEPITASHFPEGFQQAGWAIECKDYVTLPATAHLTPSKLTLERVGIKVKLAVQHLEG